MATSVLVSSAAVCVFGLFSSSQLGANCWLEWLIRLLFKAKSFCCCCCVFKYCLFDLGNVYDSSMISELKSFDFQLKDSFVEGNNTQK